jgi:hypothetical protein
MKKLLLFVSLVWLTSQYSDAQKKTQVWTQSERQNLIQGLKSSQAELLREVQGLNQTQVHFKPDSSQWSVAEVVEHLAIYEELLYWDLLNNQYTEERPDLVKKVKETDSAMVAYATDPNKGQASFTVQPLGRFQTTDQLVDYFNRFRKEVINLVDTTSADFRLHFIFRPANWGIWHIRDLHQYTLLWIAHIERHLNQIRRVKSNSNFPK